MAFTIGGATLMAHCAIEIPGPELSRFCEERGIRRLSLYGSVLRDDFGPQSDVDVLVEFRRGEKVGLVRLGTIEDDLSKLLGRKVDLNTPGFLSRYFREEVMSEAEVVYDEA